MLVMLYSETLRKLKQTFWKVAEMNANDNSGVWCLFEFLLSSRQQLELVFTTDVGVVGDDSWPTKNANCALDKA